MYEGKLKSMEEDLEKKNKMLSDVKILLREAAEREQSLLREHEELQQKVQTSNDQNWLRLSKKHNEMWHHMVFISVELSLSRSATY